MGGQIHFSEMDLENLIMVANAMRLSGCEVPGWILLVKLRGREGEGEGFWKRRREQWWREEEEEEFCVRDQILRFHHYYWG